MKNLIILVLVVLLIPAEAQIPDRFSNIKYSIVFVDQVQMLYDGLDLKKINHPVHMAGDLAYYNGKYFNASGRYFTAINGIPLKGDNNPKNEYQQGGAAISIGEITKGGLNNIFADLTLFGRLANADWEHFNSGQIRYYSSIATAVGLMHQTKGNFYKAEKLLTLALDYRAKEFGQTSAEFINSLHNMAVLRKSQGEYAEAEKMFNYLVPTARKLYQYTAPDKYAAVLNNAAMLYAVLGRTKEATEQLDEALKIGKEYFYKNYIDYERVLTNRAFLAREAGEYELANSLYQRALHGMETKGFEKHPDYNNVLIYYGAFQVAKGEENLEGFLDEVIDKVRNRYNKQHPLYAKAVLNKADYYMLKNRFDLAQPLLLDAQNAQRESLGSKHLDYLNTTIKLAIAQWNMSDLPSARSSFDEAISGFLFQVETIFSTLSESEKSDFWNTMKPAIDNYMAFVLSVGNDDQSLLQDAYNIHIKTKGILINAATRTRNMILASDDEELTNLYKRYLGLKKLLANYYSSPLEELKEDKVDLQKLENTANELEKRLVSKTNLIDNNTSEVTYATVSNWLDVNEAAVELIRVPSNYGFDKGKIRYGALIIKKDKPIKLVVIEDGAQLESRDLKFYKNAIRLKMDDENSYKAFWKPVQDQLLEVDKAYVSVDGVYNSLNMNTLKIDAEAYVIDKLALYNLTNTREISKVKNKEVVMSTQSQAVLFGYPNFGNEAKVEPLPGTRQEVLEIENLLSNHAISTSAYLEDNASEENFTAQHAPGILHVATHGFFLPDVDLSNNMVMGTNVSKARDNPLLRAGLLFSGAARTVDNSITLNAGNNGVLNAFEIMNMDLNGTDLVIMSACETGNGEIVNGEGVYGLNRAFQIAGAEKIIMSLWKVDDQATKDLMIAFYQNWIKSEDAQQAFSKATLAIKAEYKEPYYWGAFVMLN